MRIPAVHTYQRTLSDTESRRLKSKLPWLGKRRQELLTDIEQRLIHVYEFDVLRSWDINGCRPPCCPYTYLFQTSDDLYVYVETWEEFERRENSGSRLVIESTPTTRMLVKATLEGTIALEDDEKLRELNEFFELYSGEWRAWKEHELPANVLIILGGLTLSSSKG